MSNGLASVQLVFAGEVLPGFARPDVRQKLAQLLKLDDARLDTLFGGQRVIIKRGLSAEVAAQWVARFGELGALLHSVHESGSVMPPAPAPVATPTSVAATSGDPMIPPPAPIAVNTPPVTEEITCPSCGERQPKRILCRNCACDMPRGIAAKEEEAAAERAQRREAFMARHGVRAQAPSTRSGGRSSGYATSRLGGDSVLHEAADDAPLFGLSFTGRIGRMRNFLGGLLMVTGMLWLLILAALAPGFMSFGLLLLALAFSIVWGCRLTVLRLHDVNRSAWWLLIFLVPYLGTLASLVLALWPGDAGENDHGSPPADDSSLPAIGVLVALCLSLALGWNMTWSAIQRQVAAMQAEAGDERDEPMLNEPSLPPASELVRVLHSEAAADEFRRYMAMPGHRAFAVSAGGGWGWHVGAAKVDQAMGTAVADCERRRRPYTPPCEVVHLNDHWVMN